MCRTAASRASWQAYEEMSFKEIGEIFDKSENWARVNYFRAKTKIRKVIEDENNM